MSNDTQRFLVSCDEPFHIVNDYSVTPASVPLAVDAATLERWRHVHEQWTGMQDEMVALVREHERKSGNAIADALADRREARSAQ